MERTYRNVNRAFSRLVSDIADGTIKTRKEDTRNGPVLQIDEPAMITYERPLERVLFNTERDCNPFFHVFEALWMLAGRNDVAPLAYYSSQVKNYSDDGETFNGAYGWRWRMSPVAVQESTAAVNASKIADPANLKLINRVRTIIQGSALVDQLDIITKHLKKKPNSRRVVLQMWNVEDDLLKIDNGKDVCCNTNVYFSLREVKELSNHPDAGVTHAIWNKCKVLDMTVCNRSNDLVWGMLGANAVHFSFLQEYLACRLGVEVGRYTQFSNNLHVYTENNSGFHPEKWLANGSQDFYITSAATNFVHVPLVRDPVMFDREVKEFVELHRRIPDCEVQWVEPFLELVAHPMINAFHCHKVRDYPKALEHCGRIHATDWRLAAINWINKRRTIWEAKQWKGDE